MEGRPDDQEEEYWMIQDLKEENQGPGGSTEWLHIIRKRTTRWDRREGHQRAREDRGQRIEGRREEA